MHYSVLLLRSVLFQTLFSFGIVFFGILVVVAGPFRSRQGRWKIARAWGGYNVAILRLTCGIRHRIEGVENLPEPPFIILSKHQSAWETVTFPALFPPIVYVLKKSLKYIPFFGWALWVTQQIFIDRDQKMEAMRRLRKECRRAVDDGFCMVIFPEGTRVAYGEVGEFKRGGIAIAAATKAPLVPVAHNAGTLWGPNAFLKRPGEITVRIGKPIASTGLDRKGRGELPGKVAQEIESLMQGL
ncbi:MAG: 1-acyl-sn-glycerol-3-phosphate acyltransferase [Magnetococcales bacterium]|nr:1-acyl-sn-glycerol-3-phosphate acyltransferase [Magnetococcales bacterium]